MDRRLSTRKRLQQHVTLQDPQVGPITACLRNVSLSGAFIDTAPHILPRNIPVIIAFQLRCGRQNYGFCLDASVVRHEQSKDGHATTGAGIMFNEMPAYVIQSLSDALSQ